MVQPEDESSERRQNRADEFDLEREALPLPKEKPEPEREPRDVVVPLRTRRTGRQAAYLAQVRLSCTLVVTGRDQ